MCVLLTLAKIGGFRYIKQGGDNMRKFKLLNFRQGISKTGKPYASISIMSTDSNARMIKDFFVDPEVLNNALASGVVLDSTILVSCELNERMLFSITSIKALSTVAGSISKTDS